MKLSIGYKLMLSYMLFVVVPVCIIGYYSYTTSVNAVRGETEIGFSRTLQQTVTNIEYRLTEIERAANQLFYDNQFQNALFNFTGGYEGYKTVTLEILPRLDSAKALTSFNIWMSLYASDSSFPERYNTYTNNPVDAGKSYDIYNISRITNSGWYANYLSLGVTTGTWEQVDDDAKYGNISYLTSVLDFQNGTNLGLLRITANLQDLFASVQQMDMGAGSIAAIVDEQQKPQFQTDSSIAFSDLQKNTSNYLVVKETIPDLNWSLLAYVPHSALEQSSNQLLTITVLICLLVVLVLAVVGWYMARKFAHRVTRITNAFREFQIGDFRQRIADSGIDELAQIEQAFNEMAGNVEALIREVYVSGLKKKEAELNMLQAQINPHFLYNSLSAVSRLSQLGATEQLQEMVLSLAKFYRLSLNKGKLFVSIDEELQHIRTYLDIQKIRYGDDVKVSYDIEPTILDCITLKLILQPFVENILEHARFMGTIHIRIIACKEAPNIVFSVIDDGVGFDEELLARFQQHSPNRPGYGINNVDQRIKLQYGDEYGISIYSQFGVGTTVKVTIPALAREECQPQHLTSGPLPLSATMPQ